MHYSVCIEGFDSTIQLTNPPSKHEMLTQCWLNVLMFNFSPAFLVNISCWVGIPYRNIIYRFALCTYHSTLLNGSYRHMYLHFKEFVMYTWDHSTALFLFIILPAPSILSDTYSHNYIIFVFKNILLCIRVLQLLLILEIKLYFSSLCYHIVLSVFCNTNHKKTNNLLLRDTQCQTVCSE